MSSAVDNAISVFIDQNEYLAEGVRTVDAIITVETPADMVVAAPAKERVEILIIDCSGSMGNNNKLEHARRAATAALDVLPDGTRFTIIEGTDQAEVVFPRDSATAVMNRQSRSAAQHALKKLHAHGGTAMGTWLGLSRMVAEHHPDAMVHAILLTDGKNEHETVERLTAEIKASEGVFTCDCRGIGTDWHVADLRAIALALHGTADIATTPEELAAEFAAMVEMSMAKTIPELTLRVWSPAGATVRFIKQVAPQIEDLTGRRTDVAPLNGEYPLGAWGAEERDYHIQIDVEPADAGREKLAARISVLADGAIVGQGLVRAVWTTDTDLSARISRRVAHYTGQAELAQAVQEGLAARKQGDLTTATAKLQRAVELANESGNEATAKLLATVVDVDERTGTARLRTEIDDMDERALDMRSVLTARVRKEDGA
ncbi:VWA domain-containing protein [Nocardia sp. IFM 10818]